MEKIAGFNRVRFVLDLENKKLLSVFENLVGTTVERSQRRFRGVIADKHKLSCQEGPRKRMRLRRRDDMMM